MVDAVGLCVSKLCGWVGGALAEGAWPGGQVGGGCAEGLGLVVGWVVPSLTSNPLYWPLPVGYS